LGRLDLFPAEAPREEVVPQVPLDLEWALAPVLALKDPLVKAPLVPLVLVGLQVVVLQAP